MICLAAVGDVHFGLESRGQLSCCWKDLEGTASALLIAGDLTKVGHIEEAEILAQDLAECPVPVITVFGNHDYHSNQQNEIRKCLEESRVTVLEKESTVLKVSDKTIGIYGLKGFGGGFQGACCSDFGEPETKAFVGHTKSLAKELLQGLRALDCDYKVALMHYSPTAETLLGEKKEIYPFLGSYLLAQALDEGGADVAFHGHAHRGIEHGRTMGGVQVRNVAQPVIQKTFRIYSLDEIRKDLTHRVLVHG